MREVVAVARRRLVNLAQRGAEPTLDERYGVTGGTYAAA